MTSHCWSRNSSVRVAFRQRAFGGDSQPTARSQVLAVGRVEPVDRDELLVTVASYCDGQLSLSLNCEPLDVAR